MVNKRLWLGILVMTLVFGMSVVGVEAQSNNSGIDGMWVFSEVGGGIFKFEKGKFLVFDDDGEFEEEMSYTIRGNSLIIDGEEYKFSIKENTLTLTQNGKTLTVTKITESQSPVGRWVPEIGQLTRNSFPDSLELTSDGTGIGGKMGLKWKIENSRITIDLGVWGAYAYYYIIYKSNLILTNDDGRCVRYIKR